MNKSVIAWAALLAAALLVPALWATEPLDSAGLDRLVADSGGSAKISVRQGTGAVQFVTFAPGTLPLALPESAAPEARAAAFFQDYGSVFGIRSAAEELVLTENRVDRLGNRRLSYEQRYQGVPVFGGLLRAHFDAESRMTAVNGTFVPGISVDTGRPRRDAEAAGRVALGRVGGSDLEVLGTELYVFRAGLVRGIEGPSHLVWEVEAGNGRDVREFVYVDAHTGKVVDQISGIHEAMHRTIHDMSFGNIIWDEGDPLPYVSTPPDPVRDPDINGLIDYAEDVYDVFMAVSGDTFPSWDGMDGVMHSVFDDPTISCPNANWNGVSTNYCTGVAGDDTVAHEWGHAYTDSTHNLIYQWQSGALNESYSDMIGEIVDFINGAGTDSPIPVRGPDGCSIYGGSPPPTCTVNAPPEIAGVYAASGADFNPPGPITVTGDVELADDGDDGGGTGTVNDGCEPLVDFTSGNIALIDRGSCNFTVKVVNAQNAGAIGVKIANDRPGLINMGGADPEVAIASVMIQQTDGEVIKSVLETETVNATIELGVSDQDSYRWLSGEDDPAFGGAIRDMWNPNCYGDPGKVGDVAQYVCDDSDGGGVHTNSGVPNHEFSLLVDGGTFNGETISALGLTKATHIMWRTMTVYQGPTTNFVEHADAMEAACADLIGVDLFDLVTGDPSGEMLSAADCAEVAEALLATEMRVNPDFCGFTPLLDPDAPAVLCNDEAFFDDFEADPAGTWTLTNEGVFDEYDPRDWEWTADVPPGGTGSAFFGIDSIDIGDCVPGSDDQSGVMHLDSPPIVLPAGSANPVLVFDHWVATEAGFDGGNLKVNVNGGGFVPIAGADFSFNPYNDTLTDAAGGNTNPMAGEDAFTGTDGGLIGGSWGQSQVDLSAYAGAGDSVVLRFDLGVDGCNGAFGWFVDNVQVCGSESSGIFADGFESGNTSAWSNTVP